MALTNDDIQQRNTILQSDLKIANANRKRITDALGATAPTTASYGGYPSPVYASGQQKAYENYQGQLADSDKEMAGITARAQQLTKDANAFTDSANAQGYAAKTGVPLTNQPSAPASTAATAGATAPAGGQPSLYQSPFKKPFSAIPGANDPAAPGAGTGAAAAKPAARTINLGASSEFGGGGPVKDSLASSFDKNGVPTYDNASIARLIQRNGGDAVPSSGSQPYAAAAPIYNAGVGYNGPAGPGLGVVIADPNNDPTKRLLSDLGTEIFRASLNPNSRSKRDVLSTLYGQKAGIIGQGNQIASNESIAAQNRATELARTNLTEAGANQRSNSQIQGQMAVEGMRQSGDAYRALLGAMPKPRYTTDANGNYVQINGVTSTPVLGTDGKPLALLKNSDAETDLAKTKTPLLVEALKGANARANDMQADPKDRSDAAAEARAILQMAGIGGKAGTKPTLDEFMQKARAANPGASDSDLKAYYTNKYGN